MEILRQGTAATVKIGPFLDDTDGKTTEELLTIANTDINLHVNGASAVDKNSGGGTHDIDGYYAITLDTTDLATVGRLKITVNMAGALPVQHHYQIVSQNVFDALYASSADGSFQSIDDMKGAGFATGTHSLVEITEDVTGLDGAAMRGTDGANTVTPNTVAPDNATISAINTAVGEIQGAGFDTGTHSLVEITEDVTGLNGAAMRGTDGANTVTPNTVAPDNATISAINTAVGEIQGAGFDTGTHSLVEITEDVTGLNGAAMRGTDGANTVTPNTVAPDNATISAINAVTAKLDTALELFNTAYRFTTDALSQAPTGGLDEQGIRDAIGMASANMDNQLSGILNTLNQQTQTLTQLIIDSSLTDEDKNALIAAVCECVKNVQVVAVQERVLLGPCEKEVTEVPQVAPQRVVQQPPVVG